jgi:hypothetical protein
MWGGDEVTALYLGRKGVRFHRMIAADDVIAHALAGELLLRNVCPAAAAPSAAQADCARAESRPPPGRIAIVSEWDTAYGQTLPETMGLAFCSDCKFGEGRSLIERFSYLRGLDGQLPQDQAAGESASASQANRDGGRDKKKDDRTSSDTARRL